MAQINFPTATSNGQTFEADNGVIYTYVGTPPNGFWSGSFQATGLSTLDARFLKLDSSNDPVTGGLNVTGGNVGIGTTSPAFPLEVNRTDTGTVVSSFESATSAAYVSVVSSSTDTNNVRFGAIGNDAVIQAGASEAMRIDSSGNVGIGTNAPSSKLEVNGFIQSSQGLKFNDTDSDYGLFPLGSQTLAFNINGDEKLRIAASGNVGIGTNSPAQLLDIASTAPNITLTDTVDGYSEIDGNAANLKFNADKGNEKVDSNIIFAVDNSEKARITSDGNVAIGVSDLSSLGAANSPAFGVGGAAGNRVGIYGNGGRWWYAHGEAANTLTVGARVSSNTGDADIVTLNTNGRVGIGTTSPTAELAVAGTAHINRPANWWTTNAFFGLPGLGHFGTEGSYRTAITSNGYRATSGWVSLNANNRTGAAQIGLDPIGKILMGTDSNKAIGSGGSPTARMIIDKDGEILIHQFTSSRPGFGNTTTGAAFEQASSGSTLYVSRDGVSGVFNRNSNGDIVQFRRNGLEQGDIRVSGSTVTYAGGHLSRFAQLKDNGDRIEILRGSVLSNIDQMCVWDYDAKDPELWTEDDEIPEGAEVGDVKIPGREAGTELNEQLNRMKVSDVEGDPNVSGVFEDWDDDDEIYTKDFFCAMTGDFVIRIAQGTTVARGDLLMSAGDGTAKPQEDDIVRSKTIAKVSSTVITETYADGSYIVPCVLMAC